MRSGEAASRRTVALVWDQFAPYHIDRIEAVAARLGPGYRVIAVEIAATSHAYAWAVSGVPEGSEKLRLFDGIASENVASWRKFTALLRALDGVDIAMLGLFSSAPWTATLAFILRSRGTEVWFGSDSKADDYFRPKWVERVKRALLKGYSGAIVAGSRGRDYYLSLGVDRQKILPGYDTLSVGRVAALAGGPSQLEFHQRPFLFLGRFVEKKGLFDLLRAYAGYCARTAGEPRRLVMAGSGPQEVALRDFARELGVDGLIDWPGFVDAGASAALMRHSVALLLLSKEEQWGLVINEAIAVGLPVIATRQVGATDLLVASGVNGFVVANDDATGACDALVEIGADETRWAAMAEACAGFSWAADCERFADTIEFITDPNAASARDGIAQLKTLWR